MSVAGMYGDMRDNIRRVKVLFRHFLSELTPGNRAQFRTRSPPVSFPCGMRESEHASMRDRYPLELLNDLDIISMG